MTKKLFEAISKHYPYILFLLALAIIPLWKFIFSSDIFFGDMIAAYLPRAELIKISIQKFHDFWPLWNPYGFSGTPFLMKPIIGTFSLLGLYILLIPNTLLALKLTYLTFFFISGISMYALMVYYKVGRKSALISAVVYMFNGHIIAKILGWGWLTTLGGYSLIPLIFLFGTKALKEKNWVFFSVITGIIFSIQARTGPDMKVGLWTGLLFGIFLIYHTIIRLSSKRFIKLSLTALIIILVFFGLTAQVIFPVKSYISMSSRAQTSWDKASGRQLHLNKLIPKLIEPGLPKFARDDTSSDHIGIIAFLLACFAAYKKRKNKTVLFFLLSSIISILIASNTFNLYYFLWKLPLFGSMRYMDRSLFLFVFSASILAGFGSYEILKRSQKYRKLIFLSLVILMITNLYIFSYRPVPNNPDVWRNFDEVMESNQILQHLSNIRESGEIFRIQTWETRGIDFGTDAYNVPLELEHIYSYDTTWYPPYMNVYLAVGFNNPAKFWGILNTKFITSTQQINISGFKFIRRFEDCKICFPELEQWNKAWGPYLYENEEFMPRAFIVNNSILIVGEEQSATQTIYSLMLDNGFNPSNTVIIRGKQKISDYNNAELKKYKAIFLTQDSVDQNSGFILKNYVNSGGILLPDLTKNKNNVGEEELQKIWNSFSGSMIAIPNEDIIMHNFDKREIKLNKNYKGFLVLSEKFSVFSGWEVTADGNKRELLNADSMISSIYLDGNENTILFEYKPKPYIIGLYITLTTLILLTIYFVCRKIKK
jgi:hypothetical protein